MSEDTCQIPNIDFGILYKTATGEALTRPMIVLDVPHPVQRAIRKACDKVIQTGAGAVEAGGTQVGRAAGFVAGKVKGELAEAKQTAGAIISLRPQDISEEHKKTIYKFLESKAQNKPDMGIPDVAGATKVDVPGALLAPVAGWLRMDDLKAAVWIDDNKNVVGAIVKASWALP